MTYDEVVVALGEELGCDVQGLRIAAPAWFCDVCGSREHGPLFSYFLDQHPESIDICADRPACRARAKRLNEEREQAVVEAVKL